VDLRSLFFDSASDAIEHNVNRLIDDVKLDLSSLRRETGL
jgi:hypothetical protein